MRAFSPTKARASGSSTEPDQTSRPSSASSDAIALDVSHEAHLRQPEQLLAVESSRTPVLLQAAVRDQLDDAAGGIAEVAGEGVPEGEIEDERRRRVAAGSRNRFCAQSNAASNRPARDEECEVVERAAFAGHELEPAPPEWRVEAVQRRKQPGRRAQARAQNLHGPEAMGPGPRSSSSCGPRIARSSRAGSAPSRERARLFAVFESWYGSFLRL